MSFATESDEGEILNIAASEDIKNGDLIVCEIIIIIIIKKMWDVLQARKNTMSIG